MVSVSSSVSSSMRSYAGKTFGKRQRSIAAARSSIWILRTFVGAAISSGSSSSTVAAAFVPTRIPVQPQRFLSSHTGGFTRSDDHLGNNERLQTAEESKMTGDCMKIINAAIEVVKPKFTILNHCQKNGNLLQIGSGTETTTYDLSEYDNLLLISFGKASSGMATSLVQVLTKDEEDKLISKKLSGMVIVKDDHATAEEVEVLSQYNIQVQEASHPVPDERSVKGTSRILAMVEQAAQSDGKTLALVCISGGGSALFCAPHPKVSLVDLQTTNSVLLQSGMSIQETNVIRKKLETAKGGGLLARAAISNKTTLMSLILSDVLGDPLDLIASGPTVPDTSSWQDAWDLVQQNSLDRKGLPLAVLQFLENGKDGAMDSEKQIPTSSFAGQAASCLVGNNALAVERAAQVAHSLGYSPIVLGTEFRGESKDVANILVSMAQQIQQSSERLQPYTMAHKFPIALIAGGETTVTIPASCKGKGGRNQELALAAALAMREQRRASGLPPLRNIVFASVGTDGTDGPTDAAGAVVDGGTVSRLPGNPLEYMQHHDAYNYLDQCDAEGKSPLIRTNPTGTNVADIMVVLIDRERH